MAKYRITSPDGQSYEITAPDDARPEQILAYARDNAPKLDAFDRRVLDEFPKPSGMASVGRGMMDVGQGLKQAGLWVGEQTGMVPEGTTAAYTREKTEEERLYERGRGKDAGVDWGRVGGNIVATLPVAAIPGANAATLGARVASGAAQGALASGAMFTPEGGNKVAQTAVGAAVGGAVPVVLAGVRRGIGALVDKFRNGPAAQSAQLRATIEGELRSQGVDPAKLARSVVDELVADAQEALKTPGAKLDAARLARKADIAAIGGTPFKAAITRNPADWQQFQNTASIRGVGDPLVRVKEQNALALTEALQKAGAGRGKNAYAVGESVFDAVGRKEDEMQKVVGAMYKTARDQYGKAMTSHPGTLIGAMDDVAVRADADPITTTIKRYLTRRGILDADGAIKPDGYLSLTESEELRKLIRDVSWDKGRSMRDIGNRLISALDDDVFSAFPAGNPLSDARAAAAAKFNEFSARTLKNILDDKITPEQFVQNVVLGKGKIDELRALRNVLTTGTKDQVTRGKAAMADIKGAVLDSLLKKATGATDAATVEGAPFSGRNFGKALDAIEWQKLNLIFNPKEIDTLRQIQRASKALTEEVPYSDVNYSRTGAAIANLIDKLAKTPLAGEVVQSLRANVRGQLASPPAVNVPVGPRPLLPAGPAAKLLPGAAGAALYPVSQ